MGKKRTKIWVQLNEEDAIKFEKVKKEFYVSYDTEVFKILLRKYRLEEN